MQISPTVLKNIKKIVFLKYEPSDRTVMWAKPVEIGGFEFLVYNNGAWQQLSEEEGITINISDVTGDLSTFNNDAGFVTSAEVLPSTTKYAGSQSVGGAADKAISIPFGQVDSTSTATAFTATVEGITELRDGVAVWLKNGVIKSSTSSWTLDINGLGAKNVVKSMQMSSGAGNTFDTNYAMMFIFDATQDVWMMNYGYYSDSNDKAYLLRAMNTGVNAYNIVKGLILLLTKGDNLLAINESGATGALNKVITTESFNPFGGIWVYTNGNAIIQPGEYISNAYLWNQYTIDLRRSFNITSNELENRLPLYLVAVPQNDGNAKLHSTPITQALPSTEDGFIYIYLGLVNQNYLLDIYLNHPIYYFKDGAIRLWTNQDTTALKLGTSTVGSTTQGIYLNQGVPAACESYDMWYMKHIAALYGATRNDATGLWSYYYINCARWDDTNEQIVWDRNIGYDDITDAEMMDMCDHRLYSLNSVYGWAKGMQSRIAFHYIGYGNNQGSNAPQVYCGNNTVVTYGYVGIKGSANGGNYYPHSLGDMSLVKNVKHIIGRSGFNNNTTAPASATKLEYVTITYGANNKTIDLGVCPNLEFVSVMYTVSNGLTYTGCKLILHPDVYAKIFDSTNENYTLWHKIDLANQARTNPITIQSA